MSVNNIIFSDWSSTLNSVAHRHKKHSYFSRSRRFSTISANLGTFMEFPYLPEPQRKMMVHLVSTVETRLDPQLLPCTLPEDVRRYCNQKGTSEASLHIRSGHNSSQIDFILGSWIHCALPTGGLLDITSLSLYLKSSTDAPKFLMDMIQSSPKSLTLLLDLSPRKDLVLHPDYIKKFYEDTNLEAQRQSLSRVPEVKPYFSPSLYIRSLLSPTAILVQIEAETAGRMEEIVADHVHPVAKEVLRVWLEECACGEREVSEAEREDLQKRDDLSKAKTLEVELGSSLPRLFGTETANRVIDVMREYFFVS